MEDKIFIPISAFDAINLFLDDKQFGDALRAVKKYMETGYTPKLQDEKMRIAFNLLVDCDKLYEEANK